MTKLPSKYNDFAQIVVGRGVDPWIDVLFNPKVETGSRIWMPELAHKTIIEQPYFLILTPMSPWVSKEIRILSVVWNVSFQLPDSLTALLNISTSSRSVGLALWKIVPNKVNVNRLDALQNPVKSNKMSCFALYAILRCSHLFEIRVNLKTVTLT